VINLLRISGGLFFFYLARQIIRNALRPPVEKAPKMVPASRTFWQAVTAIWISPAVYINWTTVGVPGLLTYTKQALWRGIAFLLIFYTMWIGGLAVQIVLFGQAGRINPQMNKWILVAAGMLLVGFGFYQIWLGVTALA
jgi:threonine/homoserine/homoserine lactone efflux protein